MQLEPATAHTPHQMCEVESEETQLREKGQIATKDLLQGCQGVGVLLPGGPLACRHGAETAGVRGEGVRELTGGFGFGCCV